MVRLSTRLEALERPTAAGLTPDGGKLLVSVLGRRDALFWPWRFELHSSIPYAEIRTRQREYLAGTIGVAAKADGANQWKAAMNTRALLISAGLCTATLASGQVQSLFLTQMGEATARALVGDRLATFDHRRELLLMLLKLLSESTPVKAVRESVLFGQELHGCPDGLEHLTDEMLPLLTAGCVVADSDTEGRACYTPTDVPPPERIAVDVAAVDQYDQIYLTAFKSERVALKKTEPRDSSAIVIPLPATGWGWPIHFEEARNERE